MIPAHEFDDTGEAYDACQCDESIKNGDTLVIPSEGVVGMAHTWPVAVTTTSGHLHQVIDVSYFDDHFTPEQVAAAKLTAASLGFPLSKVFTDEA